MALANWDDEDTQVARCGLPHPVFNCPHPRPSRPTRKRSSHKRPPIAQKVALIIDWVIMKGLGFAAASGTTRLHAFEVWRPADCVPIARVLSTHINR